jgi:hypothetical protein
MGRTATRAMVRPFLFQRVAAHDDYAEQDVEEDGLEGCVAEVSDDEVAEGGYAAACNTIRRRPSVYVL